ncbi:type III secretion system translocator chaperone SicA [Sodalis endosymbiont of Spalangia cameroni]|uniref:type III secretion system translocator chaperone SicA n=1 Tax=Sodalis praecaptivus TaxID=1239307 RepID=UPI0031F9ED6B
MKTKTKHAKSNASHHQGKLEQQYTENFMEAIQDGATLKDIHQIPESTMQDVYLYAYDFYQQGRLDDAESLFRFLCVYDFYNPEYIMGLAAVHQLKKSYEKAIELYALTYSLSENDYRPMLYAGQCNLMLRKGEMAQRCFEIVLEKSQDENLMQKAQAYLVALADLEKNEADATGENKEKSDHD